MKHSEKLNCLSYGCAFKGKHLILMTNIQINTLLCFVNIRGVNVTDVHVTRLLFCVTVDVMPA